MRRLHGRAVSGGRGEHRDHKGLAPRFSEYRMYFNGPLVWIFESCDTAPVAWNSAHDHPRAVTGSSSSGGETFRAYHPSVRPGALAGMAREQINPEKCGTGDFRGSAPSAR